MKNAFTLLEVMVVCAVLALLVAIAIPATSRATRYAARVKSISNLRQIGVAARLFATDHDQKIPGPPERGTDLKPGDGAEERWPKQFCAYLSPSDPRVFLDPTDSRTARLPLAEVLSDAVNNTGYIYNGFSDLANGEPSLPLIPLTLIEHPTEVVLMSQKNQGAEQFYVNLFDQPLATILGLLNPKAYDGGSHYLYVDGSVRFLRQSEYSNALWLSSKPGGLLPPIFNPLPPPAYVHHQPPGPAKPTL